MRTKHTAALSRQNVKINLFNPSMYYLVIIGISPGQPQSHVGMTKNVATKGNFYPMTIELLPFGCDVFSPLHILGHGLIRCGGKVPFLPPSLPQ